MPDSGPIYPAPVSPLEEPFYSDVDFNTNITRSGPGAFPWDGDATTSPVTTPRPLDEEEVLRQKADLCREEEDCKKLDF